MRPYVIVRDMLPGELSDVGRIRVEAYQAGGHLAPVSAYTPTLAALGSADDGLVLVAAVEGPRIVGTVMLQPWPQAQEVATGPGETVIRALAVAPDGQGRGVGRALLHAAIERAAALGTRHLVLSTQQEMRAAHHLYEEAGFTRLPDRDWSPGEGKLLLAYGLILDARHRAAIRES
ncbi:MAG: GNAT family N-acetyltransferase [Streptosporangiaceae bacterium]